jgi:hypothetical protein
VCGALAGHGLGEAFQPLQGGTSVAFVGILGGLGAIAVLAPDGAVRRFRPHALAGLLLALLDTALGDIHGAPYLVGFAIAAAWVHRDERAARLSAPAPSRTGERLMVTKSSSSTDKPLAWISVIVRLYVAIGLGTIALLAVLAAAAPHQATQEAWVHAVIVAVFAVVLPLRLRAARVGSVGGLRAVGLISAILFLVNLVEAMLPHLFPVWMRVQMVLITVLMLAVVGLVIREHMAGHPALRHPTAAR